MKRNYFDKMKSKFYYWAGFIDLSRIFPATKRFRQTMVEEVDREGRILDLCCGSGAVAIFIAKSHPHSQIYGLDLSPDLLAVARKKSMGLENVHFIKGIAQVTPFPDYHFDIISISFALHEMPRELRIKVFKEVLRLLKNNGKCLIMDIRKAEGWSKYIFYLCRKLFEPPSVFEFNSEDLRQTLKEIGFSSISQRYISFARLLVAKK